MSRDTEASLPQQEERMRLWLIMPSMTATKDITMEA
jgi:hypothetical protein